MKWIILIIIVLIIATYFDLKYQGLGYKMMPKSLQQLTNQWFKRT